MSFTENKRTVRDFSKGVKGKDHELGIAVSEASLKQLVAKLERQLSTLV